MATSYSLTTSYSGQGLIDNFNFVSITDPTLGFVSYQDYPSALSAGLVSVDASTNAVKLSVDTTSVYASDGSQGGRPSVRIESKASVNQGLVIGDFSHMPGSVCGAWPAFWMYGPNWPNGGEVDIIEGANLAYDNLMSAHTSANCLLPSSLLSEDVDAGFTGTQQYLDCADTTYGCNYVPPPSDMSSYGDDFNGVGGGVYALQWTDEAIKIWHFARADIPADIVAKEPDPSGWGRPQALFGSASCDVESHFNNMNIVLNIDFCGTYAGNLWASDATCSTYADTCVDWVANNPEALTELYWEVNYIDVYSSTLVELSPAPTIAAPAPPLSNVTLSIRPSETTTPANAGNSVLPSPPSTRAGAAVTNTATAPLSAVSPVDSIVPRHNPATIDVYSYLGCFASTSGFSSFDLAGTDPALTLETCVGLCSGKKYAGAVGTTCYCANTLDAGTGAVSNRASCSTPCPGNGAEYCGGLLPASKRASLAPNVLLTMYANINGLNSTTPPPAPALGSNTTGTTTNTNSSRAAATTTSVQTITSTVTYTTVCSTNPAQLVTLTYCTTITVCPTSAPSIPQTVITQNCAGCGQNGSSVVTLTIPVAVLVTRTSISLVTATGFLNNPVQVPVPVPTTALLPVTAAAAPRGTASGFLLTLLGFVGMLV